MAPKSDKKFSEVFDALGKVNQFTQNNRDSILGAALSAPTAGLPVPQIKGAIENTIGGIRAAGNFANNNPQIQSALNNEYLGLAAGLNPVTSAASMFGNLSRLAGNFGKGTTSKKTTTTEPGGSVTRVGGKTYRMDNSADVKDLNAVLAADKASRPGQQFADLRSGGVMTTQTPPVGPPSPSTDPRNSDYLSARKALTTDSSAADIKKVEDIGMTAWAKANPKLAAKVKPGQAGYGVIQGLEKAKDQTEAVSDYKVMGGNAEEGNAIYGGKGGSVEVDIDGSGPETVRIKPESQAFKDNAMTALLTNFGNTNVEPIVEGITLPTTTDYAGAFNQTDVPDLQSMMNMGEQLGNVGYEGPSFSQSFKDRFQNMMLGK